MVGSVLLERMRAEKDFAQFEPVFFTTSNVGGAGPKVGGAGGGKLLGGKGGGGLGRVGGSGGGPCPRVGGAGGRKLLDAKSVEALRQMDAIVTCQGGEYTSEIYPQLR